MKRIVFTISISCVLFACTTQEHEPLVKTGIKPDIVTNIKVTNTPGGADIVYDLPSSPNLLYVEARYKLEGKGRSTEKIVKSSMYRNMLNLEGFADTLTHTVTLYTVTRDETYSDPVKVQISPLTPPIQTVLKSITAQPDFGGVRVSFRNEEKKDYIVYTLVRDSTDSRWIAYDRLFTNAPERSYAVRGLKSKKTKFAFCLQDQWQNNSDTVFTELTPIYEEFLDKTLWQALRLPSDWITPEYSDRSIERMWDGKHGVYDYFFMRLVGCPALPNWISFDLGVKWKLSRLKVWQYCGAKKPGYLYGLSNPKIFEIYGWTGEEKPKDEWTADWKLIAHCESVKPSGLPYGQSNEEDWAYALAGEDFDIDFEAPPVQYIRFKSISTWTNRVNLLIDEISFWGQNPDHTSSEE